MHTIKEDLISYSEFTQRIRKHTASSVLFWSMTALWNAWQNGKIDLLDVESTQTGKDLHCIRSYAPKICALACLSNDYIQNEAKYIDIIKYSHQYLRIQESITDKKFFTEECKRLSRIISNLSMNGKIFPDIPTDGYDDLIKITCADFFPARLYTSQSAHVGIRSLTIIRQWAIYKILNKRLDGIVEKRLKIYMNMNPEDLIRAGFSAFTLASFPNDKLQKGFLNLDSATIQKDVGEKFNLDIEVVKLVARRLSIDKNAIRQWHDKDVLSLDEPYRKYAPLFLVNTPLIKLTSFFRGYNDFDGKYIIPSPYHMIWSLSRMLFNDIWASFKDISSVNILSEMGNAFKTYFEDFLKFSLNEHYGDFDAVEATGFKPDFIIGANSPTPILIELKNNIGSRFDKTVFDPLNIESVWPRIYESFRQCDAQASQEKIKTMFPKFGKTQDFVGILCVNDRLSADAVAFQSFLQRGDFIKKSNLKGFEIFSLDELEFYLFRLGSKQLSTLIEKKWEEGRGGDFFSEYARSKIDTLIHCTVDEAKHLEKYAEELFPGFNMAKIGNVI